MNNKPVAWMNKDDSSLSFKNHGNGWQPLYTHPAKTEDEGKVCARCGAIAFDPVITQTAKTLTDEDAKQKLIRIMGTFDLATGHADTFDELLDSLEVELKDILGYYREALRKAQEK